MSGLFPAVEWILPQKRKKKGLIKTIYLNLCQASSFVCNYELITVHSLLSEVSFHADASYCDSNKLSGVQHVIAYTHKTSQVYITLHFSRLLFHKHLTKKIKTAQRENYYIDMLPGQPRKGWNVAFSISYMWHKWGWQYF